MNELSHKYLSKKEVSQKYPFLTENMLKNLLFKDINGFRSKVVHKIGRRVILDEIALLQYISNSR